jgi:hypothetical protein
MTHRFEGIGRRVSASGGEVAMTAMIDTRWARCNGHQCPKTPLAAREVSGPPGHKTDSSGT